MPIIVEDLGFITREVEELKNEFGFPGMKILQFTFDEPLEENSVVYTGTHDNDTTVGWYMKVKMKNPEVENALKKYFNISGEIDEKALCWILIEAALSSKANTAVIPMQDLLCLGSEARMNIPNTIGGKNWGWRLEKRLLTPELAQKLAELSAQYGRNKKSFGEFP